MAEGRDLRGREFVFFLSKKRVSRLEEAWFTFRRHIECSTFTVSSFRI